MSKIFRSVKKAVSGLWKGIKKGFKKVWGSTLGKVIIIAAAIWLGGAAFGLWNTPFSSINGAFVSGAQQGVVGGSTLSSAGGLEVGSTAAAGTPGFAPSVAAATDQAVLTGAQQAGGSMLQQAGSTLIKEGVKEKAKSTLLSNLVSGMKENPLLTYMGMQGIAAATAPTPGEIAEEQEKAAAEARKKRFAQLAGVGDINLGIGGGDTVARRPGSGTPIWKDGIMQGSG